MGAYGEHSSRLRNFEGFKLVTNLKETKEAKCKVILKGYVQWNLVYGWKDFRLKEGGGGAQFSRSMDQRLTY